ncbi:hypothetical protein CDL15_Pgr028962 [Punica granatum]|uniref:Uncharacterized protein n=1 Tax=Punica granatum TaxID=22663 RepID=A0A218WWS8_PUNGR|nr:hypothetical protein CDL15_Pgr028962 [Punica granatum]
MDNGHRGDWPAEETGANTAPMQADDDHVEAEDTGTTGAPLQADYDHMENPRVGSRSNHTSGGYHGGMMITDDKNGQTEQTTYSNPDDTTRMLMREPGKGQKRKRVGKGLVCWTEDKHRARFHTSSTDQWTYYFEITDHDVRPVLRVDPSNIASTSAEQSLPNGYILSIDLRLDLVIRATEGSPVAVLDDSSEYYRRTLSHADAHIRLGDLFNSYGKASIAQSMSALRVPLDFRNTVIKFIRTAARNFWHNYSIGGFLFMEVVILQVEHHDYMSEMSSDDETADADADGEGRCRHAGIKIA